MTEIYEQNNGSFFLKPQINHIYPVINNGTRITKFAVYRGILHSKNKHIFMTLEDNFIGVYNCNIGSCVLDVSEIMDEIHGIPRIMTTPPFKKLEGPVMGRDYTYFALGKSMGTPYEMEYPILKKIFDQYQDKEAHIRAEFDGLIKKVLSDSRTSKS